MPVPVLMVASTVLRAHHSRLEAESRALRVFRLWSQLREGQKSQTQTILLRSGADGKSDVWWKTESKAHGSSTAEPGVALRRKRRLKLNARRSLRLQSMTLGAIRMG